MIYADPSFLCSLYGWDGNTGTAQATFERDPRRPLCFTPWKHNVALTRKAKTLENIDQHWISAVRH